MANIELTFRSSCQRLVKSKVSFVTILRLAHHRNATKVKGKTRGGLLVWVYRHYLQRLNRPAQQDDLLVLQVMEQQLLAVRLIEHRYNSRKGIPSTNDYNGSIMIIDS